MHRSNRLLLVVALVLGGITIAPTAGASGFGPRFGLTIDPDQVHGGLQFHVGNLSPHVSFVPSFEVGVGDELIGVAGNMDFFYTFGGRSSWRPYLGGGPGIFFWDADGYDSQTDVGVNLVGGMRTRTRSGSFFGELRLGLIDEPDVKFTIGWMFR
jgi:hypothetical protein